jgi:hypothetical protein
MRSGNLLHNGAFHGAADSICSCVFGNKKFCRTETPAASKADAAGAWRNSLQTTRGLRSGRFRRLAGTGTLTFQGHFLLEIRSAAADWVIFQRKSSPAAADWVYIHRTLAPVAADGVFFRRKVPSSAADHVFSDGVCLLPRRPRSFSDGICRRLRRTGSFSVGYRGRKAKQPARRTRLSHRFPEAVVVASAGVGRV